MKKNGAETFAITNHEAITHKYSEQLGKGNTWQSFVKTVCAPSCGLKMLADGSAAQPKLNSIISLFLILSNNSHF